MGIEKYHVREQSKLNKPVNFILIKEWENEFIIFNNKFKIIIFIIFNNKFTIKDTLLYF